MNSNLEELSRAIFSGDKDLMERFIFASIFVHQNKIQTACDKLDSEVTMKQWLLLAVISTFKEPMSLSKIGELMGCSRQNVKKLATALEKKGFIKLTQNKLDSRSTCILLDEKMNEYVSRVGDMQEHVLKILFEDFSDEEIKQYFSLVSKLYTGIEKVENYTEKIKNSRKKL
ncbi:MAG: MarR family winged helix-turn-helix transcriptional regulator [Intestinibacter sp.]